MSRPLRYIFLALLLPASCMLDTTGREPRSSATAAFSGPVGFAAGTTGGLDAPHRVVSSLADAGPGTLREAAESEEPSHIRFAVSGIIELLRPIKVKSNKTIDGREAAVTIANKGLEIAGESNIIVSDLTFARLRGVAVDGIQIRNGSRMIWVNHCEFTDGEDGAVDVTRGATDITISWNHFHDFDKTMLINGEAELTKPRVTLHHNLFETTVQRNPRAVRAQVDAYNNYLRHWIGIGMQAAEEAEINSQGNVLEASTDLDGIVSRGLRSGAVRSTDDLAVNGARIMEREPETVFEPPYSRTVQPADETLSALIRSNAGPREQLP
jgi:pectate lyase